MKTYLVIGAERSGIAVTRALLLNKQSVILTDTKDFNVIAKASPAIAEAFEALPKTHLSCFFGSQVPKSVVNGVSAVIPSPGVPLTIPVIQEAYKKNIPVISEVEAAYRMTSTPFIGITGTNGKTTTTSLTGEIFKLDDRYPNVYVVGNIGNAVTHYVNTSTPSDLYVAELSSFQLETTDTFRPKAAAILNLSPDHLDRHGTLDNYYKAKAKIFQNQTPDDILVINADDDNVLKYTADAKSKKISFSLEKRVAPGIYQKDGKVYVAEGDDPEKDVMVSAVSDITIKGPHNVMNAMAAIGLTYFTGVSLDNIRKGLKDFKGVEHRQEFVVTIDGVDYINDSKGTNTDATITALKAMEKPTILIAGGYDKKEDYTKMMGYIKDKVKLMILLGATAKNIAATADQCGFSDYIFVKDYPEAVKTAKEKAVSGDVVLLSPACASWDMFANYEDRGDLFKQLVKA